MTRRGAYATIGAAVLCMAALLVAALSDPVTVLSRPRSDEAEPFIPSLPPSPSRTTPTATATETGDATGWDPSAILGVLLQFFAALVILAAIFGAALLVQAILRRRPHLVEPAGRAFAVPPVPEELLRSAPSRMALLEEGEPRNAIVAAWLDLETAAAASGLPRQASETSTEYTTRVVGTWPVDRERLEDLAQLYREARFSLHPLGEGERHRAIDDLTVLHADLEQAALDQPEREGEPT
jgi:hypothetical protein